MMKRLPLRNRLALLTTLAVAIAVAACATFSWFLVKDKLYDELDRRLGADMKGPKPPTDWIAKSLERYGCRQVPFESEFPLPGRRGPGARWS